MKTISQLLQSNTAEVNYRMIVIATDGLGYSSLEDYVKERKERNKLLELDRRFGLWKVEDIDDSLDIALEKWVERQESGVYKMEWSYKRLKAIDKQISELLSEKEQIETDINKAEPIYQKIAKGKSGYVSSEDTLEIEDIED